MGRGFFKKWFHGIGGKMAEMEKEAELGMCGEQEQNRGCGRQRRMLLMSRASPGDLDHHPALPSLPLLNQSNHGTCSGAAAATATCPACLTEGGQH